MLPKEIWLWWYYSIPSKHYTNIFLKSNTIQCRDLSRIRIDFFSTKVHQSSLHSHIRKCNTFVTVTLPPLSHYCSWSFIILCISTLTVIIFYYLSLRSLNCWTNMKGWKLLKVIFPWKLSIVYWIELTIQFLFYLFGCAAIKKDIHHLPCFSSSSIWEGQKDKPFSKSRKGQKAFPKHR